MSEKYCGLEVHELVLVIPKMSEAESSYSKPILLKMVCATGSSFTRAEFWMGGTEPKPWMSSA